VLALLCGEKLVDLFNEWVSGEEAIDTPQPKK
jgi:hypothetical protein